MKALWTLISVLAIANLLAAVGFIGWLVSNDRLNKDRVQTIRAMLSTTVAQEAAAKAAEEDAAKKAVAEQAAAARLAIPPDRAATKIEQQRAKSEVDHISKVRLDSELRSLQEFLVRENDRLQELERTLTQRESAFAAERKKIRDTEGAEQFKKVLSTLAGVKPKEATSILNEILQQRKPDEVTAYLNSLDERVRSKIIAEFNKTDPKVAADLLERLKTYGITPSVAEASPNESKQP